MHPFSPHIQPLRRFTQLENDERLRQTDVIDDENARSDHSSLSCQGDVAEGGEFVRAPSKFRDRISADGSSGYRAEPDRYHLYVSYACPWAHRTLVARSVKGLTDVIGMSVTDSFLGPDGWTLNGGEAGATGDPINGFRALREAYLHTIPDYEGTASVPVLWDTRTRRIVSNESSEIIRFLNTEFQAFAENPELDLYPEELRPSIDSINDWVYRDVNNGVYRAGFARSQAAYDRAAVALFAALDRLEELLAKSRFLAGVSLTEADVRLFTTLFRFDLVYHGHFKCNLRRLVDYENLWAYTRDIYSLPGVAETTNVEHVRRHYYRSHEGINPSRIVPIGPRIDYTEPQDRAARFRGL
jgi:putative glutathione S-transferase